MKKIILAFALSMLAISSVSAQTALNQYQPGPRLIDGSKLNLMVNTVNNLIGKGTPGAITGTTGVFSSTLSATGNFAINTNKFTVAASSGNTVVAGTLGVTGVATFTAIPIAPATGVTIGSTTFSEATLGLYTSGVAAGYKVARGETALDGTNPTPVTSGLTTIVSCSLTIKSTAAPGLSTSVVTYGTSSGTLNMYGWKPTGTGDTTLIASTGTDTIGWVCVGT